MNKFILGILLTFSLAQTCFAWPQGYGWLQDTAILPGGTTLPSNCQAKQTFIKTDASNGQQLYLCIAGTWVAQGSGGGGGTPGGSNTQVQYNSSGSFAANSGFVYNGTNVGIGSISPGSSLDVQGTIRVLGSGNIQVPVSSNYALAAFPVISGQPSLGNYFFAGAGNATASGSNDEGFGANALQSLTSGSDNVAIGGEALKNVTTGGTNIAVGNQSLKANTGSKNTAVGNIALLANTSGIQQSAVGYGALADLAGAHNDNTAIGYFAGRYYGGSTSNSVTDITQGTFLGSQTYAGSNSDTNETVIGYGAIGGGSNTTTIAGSGTTKVLFPNGNVGINSTTPGQRLDVQGTIRMTGFQLGTSSTSGYVLTADSSGVGTFQVASGGGGLTFNNVTGTTQSMSVNNGYIANNASLVTATLPSTCTIGNVVAIAGNGAGGWLLAQNSSQIVNFGNTTTTTGTGGSVASTNRYDAIELICTATNTTWSVRSSVGNLTVI